MLSSSTTGEKPGRKSKALIGGYRNVSQLNSAWHRLTQSVARVFPTHEFTWHRANGHDLTIKMGTQAQVMAIGSAVIVAGWLGVATSAMVNSNGDAALALKQAELARMQSQLMAMKSETAALKGDVAARAEALEARQQFLAALLTEKRDMAKLAKMLPRQVADDGSNFATLQGLVGPAKGKRGKNAGAGQVVTTAALTAPFRALENQQLAFVDKATGAAEAKLRDTKALIRRLGLDPSRFVASSDWSGSPQQAVGGPYVPVSADAEPRFKDLFLSWKKLNVLQAAVNSIPAYMPVKDYRYTSGFGFRYDPFNGSGAMHAGVDMAGANGEPIYASANGTVLRAGRANGYGNLVELSHGKGIDTRYGHMSAILVRPGDNVRQGQIIGRMGSTGRSTGTHLHYEIRIDGRAVNARPFLDASAFVLAAQGGARQQPPASAPVEFGPILADDRELASTDSPRMTPIRSLR